MAEAYLAVGDEAGAALEVEAARSTFVRLGAAVDLDRLGDLRPAAQDASAPDGLSPRELEVLQLVATGRTNAQIAEVMSISDKTVGRHLANIYRKIDVQTRAGATAYAFERGLAGGPPAT